MVRDEIFTHTNNGIILFKIDTDKYQSYLTGTQISAALSMTRNDQSGLFGIGYSGHT